VPPQPDVKFGIDSRPTNSCIPEKPPWKHRWLFFLGTAPIFWAAQSTPAFAQSLKLRGVIGRPGEPVLIEFSVKSPPGREPSALQWETIIPSDQLTPLEESVPGPAARAAGKALSCAVKEKTAVDYTSVCLLYGGRERIRNGVVAVLRLRLSPDAKSGSFRIRVAESVAVLPDAKRIPMEGVETVVTVRSK
jgi:hypothetical protein